jgi:hypothetical protein
MPWGIVLNDAKLSMLRYYGSGDIKAEAIVPEKRGLIRILNSI